MTIPTKLTVTDAVLIAQNAKLYPLRKVREARRALESAADHPLVHAEDVERYRALAAALLKSEERRDGR